MYLAIWTRPDIAYAVNKVAKHSHRPTLDGVRACKWLLEYLNSTRERGLEFHKGSLSLSAYADASFGDDLETRKSTCGYIIYLGTSPISWDTYIPPTTVSLSTAEAEYVSTHYCAKALCAHNNFLSELGYQQHKILIHDDNQAAIAIALQHASTHRCKHIAIQIHHLRELIDQGFVEMSYISTQIQLADVFTKALGYQVFSKHVDTLFGIPPTGHLRQHLDRLKHLIPQSIQDKDRYDKSISDSKSTKFGFINGFSE